MAESSKSAAVPKKADGTVNKTEAVRLAMDELGTNAMPVDIQKHLKKTYNMEMTTAHISNCKTEIQRQRKQAAKAKSQKPAAPKPMVQKSVSQKQPAKPAAASPAKQPSATTAKSASFSIDEIAAVKALVGRAGASDVKALIDVVSK